MEKPLKEQEIKAVLKEIDVSIPEKQMAKVFIYLIIMPFSGCFSLALLTYFFSSSPIGVICASLFIFSFCGWVTLWVLRHIQQVRLEYKKSIEQIDDLKHQKKLHQKAIIILTKSSVIYTLIIGYILVAFGFAIIYDALNLSNETGLLNNIYLSIATITTIGYGDIVPIGIGRFFASLEMIYAILYQVLAVSVGTTYLLHLTSKEN
ncbi:MAG: two pore domain potassium channel family protein [Alphaproteobacteria bacterium]|nr:two pore domain potassium channel family protein [Alphaproteobacteria bacterium]